MFSQLFKVIHHGDKQMPVDSHLQAGAQIKLWSVVDETKNAYDYFLMEVKAG